MKIFTYLVFLLGMIVTFPAIACQQPCSDEQHYQYVLLFGDDFPIPLRFRIVSWNEGLLEYSSSTPSGDANSFGVTDTLNAGVIEIGLRTMLEKQVGSQSSVTPIATCGHLEISRVTPKDVSKELLEKFPSMTLILGKDSYMTIVDYDEDLWRDLVRLFAKNAGITSCQI